MSRREAMDHVRAWEAVKAWQWAITEESLRVIADCAIGANDLAKYEALQAERGEHLENSHRVTLRGETENVAIIPVTGPIFPRANLFSYMSGATSTDILARDLRAALADRTVDAIILEIDSPGGAIAGINELAGMVLAARQQKTVVAYAAHQMASAAYWIGSGAGRVLAERTAVLGSIGVVMHIEDSKGRDERTGVKTYSIVSNVSPDKIIDPSQDEGRSKIQKNVDDMAAVFVDTVARHRGVTSQQVINGYGRGGILVGEHAVAAGLADQIGTMEGVIAELSAEGRAAHNRRFYIMARGPIKISTTAQLRDAIKAGHTAEEIEVQAVDTAAIEASAKLAGATEERTRLEALHTAELSTKVSEARAAGGKAERDRIAGIQAATMAGFEAEATKAIETGATPEAFALEQAKVAKTRGTSRAQQRGDAPAAVGHGGESDASADQQKAGATASLWDRAAKRVNGSTAARSK